MGRELRKVIPNWEHPKEQKYNARTGSYEDHFMPLYDKSYEDAIAEWVRNYLLWESGTHRDQLSGSAKGTKTYAEWDGDAPERKYYRPHWNESEATWWQVYETVSEGTPVTPSFATKEELVEYLVANGDFWDQQRRKEGDSAMPCGQWSRKAAENFVFGSGWAPSMVVENGIVKTGVEYMAEDGGDQ